MSHNLLNGIKFVWFDLDDTLYDFKASSEIALKRVYADFNLCEFFSSEDEWKNIYHRHNAALWDKYNRAEVAMETLRHDRFFLPLAEAGAPAERARKLVLPLDKAYLRHLADTGLTLPYARETLKELRDKGFRIGILSNGFTDVQYDKLRTSGLAPLIDCVVLSDEIGANKPNRTLFDYALRKAGTKAADSVLVGDNPDTDIAGALGAGWRAILFDPFDRFPSVNPRISSLNSLIDG